MTSERALELALPSIIVALVILAAIAVWLRCALSGPRHRRVPILLNGFAVISFIVGMAITAGPNPQFHVTYSKSGGFTASGPRWGVLLGALVAFALGWIAWHYDD